MKQLLAPAAAAGTSSSSIQSPAVAVAAAYNNLHKTSSKQKLYTNIHKVFIKLPQKLHSCKSNPVFHSKVSR
jgi:hypothetical protein